MSAGFELHPIPRWTEAASELVTGLVRLPTPAARVTLLETVCRSLGDELYPAFLQMLRVIESGGDAEVRRGVSTVLVDCLVSGRLPSGRLAAWGAARVPRGDDDRMRSLGPVEFVCAWYAQPSNLAPLERERFDEVLRSLIALVSAHPPAAALYAEKLAADAEDPTPGTLSVSTRDGLGALAAGWRIALEDGAEPDPSGIVAAFHEATATDDPLAAIARTAPPELLR